MHHRDASIQLIISGAPYWLEFLPADSVGVCCYVCRALREATQADRLWKDLCHKRWTYVNGKPGSYKDTYASLNGWRNPCLRRMILETSSGSRTRAAQAADAASHERNISGMDVGTSQVVVCSADTAWYYAVPPSSRTSKSKEQPDAGADADADGDADGLCAEVEFVERGGSNEALRWSSRASSLRGLHIQGGVVTEARLSVDEGHCFFGTIGGDIFVHRPQDGHDVAARIVAPCMPRAGIRVAVRQITSAFEGGSESGSKLGVLCRSPTGFQPLGTGATGGYFFLTDTEHGKNIRCVELGGGSLAGQAFPSMARGGPAVSMAPLSSKSMGLSEDRCVGGGDLFAVGFTGGTVALLDGRCGEHGGVVAGFEARHRWLERIRSSGSLLMASYGRSTSIETWDLRKLPRTSAPDAFETGDCAPGSSSGSNVLALPQPQQLDDLGCAGQAPDFWVAPHGLTVAVYGAPRKSQSFGARHSFWEWPVVRGRDGTDERARKDIEYLSPKSSSASEEAIRRACMLIPRRHGIEVNISCVVNDSDYRMKLSTGIKFSDRLMGTVLDKTRVLVDEVLVPIRPQSALERQGGRIGSIESVYLIR